MNNYFIFKKVRNITAQDVKVVLESQGKKLEEKIEEFTVKDKEIIESVVPKTTLKEEEEEEDFTDLSEAGPSELKKPIKSEDKKESKDKKQKKDLLSNPVPPSLKLKKSTKTT